MRDRARIDRLSPRAAGNIARGTVPQPVARSSSPQVALLHLQLSAGNEAVSRLLRRPTVQRRGRRSSGAEQLREGGAVTPGKTDVGGWQDADTSGPGWNASGREVGGVRRIPVDNLSGGLTDTVKRGASAEMTSEAADHRAIAILPKALVPTESVNVLVHLHGYAEDAESRPYAGWRQHRGGQVRDVDLDRVEAQLDSVGQPQLMAVLPQGGEQSQFGGEDGAHGLKFGPYLADVLAHLLQLHAFKGVKTAPTVNQVIVGAHSGGGHTTAAFLSGGGQIAGKGNPSQGRLGEVALFEAINGPSELKETWGWVKRELERLLKVLKSDIAPTAKDALVRDAPRLRAYSRRGGGYGGRHKQLEARIAGWLEQNASDLGPWRDRVGDLHRVVWTAVGHEHQVRERLDDALLALGDPARDRKTPIGPPQGTAGARPDPAPQQTKRSASETTSSSGAQLSVPAGLRVVVERLVIGGQTNAIDLTDAVFGVMHPELGGKAIPSDRADLQAEWRQLRKDIVRPALGAARTRKREQSNTSSKDEGIGSGTALPAGKTDGVATTSAQGTAPARPGKPASEKAAAAHPAEAAEWAQLNANVQKAFPNGFARYVQVRPLYAKRLGGEGPVAWLNALNFSFSFCGNQLSGLDPRLTGKLQAIEGQARALAGQVRSAGAPVVFAGAFQPRATTDKPDSLSDHALGLALHLNYANNPYIGRKGKTSTAAAAIIERIASGASHAEFWKEVGPQKKQSKHDRVVENYHAYAEVSDAVAAYFKLMDHLEGDQLAERKKEYDVVKSANSGRDPRNGFYAHTATSDGDPMLQLVLLLAEGAGLQWGGIYNSRPKDLHHFALKL